jgi:hypothetical protein
MRTVARIELPSTRQPMTAPAVTGDELDEILFRHMRPRLFERLLRAVFAAHKVAAEECAANYKKPEFDNMLGFCRRAKLEGFIRDATEMGGIAASAVRSRLSNWNHNEVWSGPVVLTASSVQSPCDLVEEAEFRSTLARSNQGVLWPEPGDDPEPDAPLYVILLHSKSQLPHEDQARHGYLPSSAYLGLPLPDLFGYAHEINLFDRFPHVVDSLLPQDWDKEAKVRYLLNARKGLAA